MSGTITTTAVQAMREAAAQLRDAATAADLEADWVERNALGQDPEYLRASLASRAGEAMRAEGRVAKLLEDARP